MKSNEYPRPLGTVVVTGAGSGLGLAVAKLVNASGGKAVSLDLNVDEIAEQLNPYRVDVSNRFELEKVLLQIVERFGTINSLVTAAGIDSCGALNNVPADDWERVLAVNLLGTVSAVRTLSPYIQQVHGRVVTVASSLALRALPEATAYCASKFGVLGFSRALAAESSGKMGVTTLIPAGMKTNFFNDRKPEYKPADDAQLNDPVSVARSVIFALQQPVGCEVREIVVCPEVEPSWP